MLPPNITSEIRRKIKIILLILMIGMLYPNFADARSGCCSWHGGVNRCDNSSGRIICNDGTYSPSCMCEPNSNNPKFRPDINGNQNLDRNNEFPSR
jgi:hypothetical protein